MRRLIPLLSAAGFVVGGLLTACASAGAPPGGPERHTPPDVVSITPDSGALNVKDKTVEFKFDEVVSDRTASGGGALDNVVLISPRTGSPDVSWHRSRISIKPHGGFRPNTAYTVTLLPGIVDLHNNVKKDSRSVTFSTGPNFPNASILGRVFDWAAQRPAPGAYIEATPKGDTTIAWVAAADSVGQFQIDNMPPGTYTVRALIDQNNNRTLDRNEKWDSLTTTTTGAVRGMLEFDAIERDTTPAIFESVAPIDSVTLRVMFDKPLDPHLPLQPALLRLQRADSSEVQITRVQWAAQYEQARHVADSTRIADSTKKADSVKAAAGRGGAPTTRPPAPPPPTATPTPGGPRSTPPPPKPQFPPPDKGIIVSVQTPLPPGRYQLTGRAFRNLIGKSAEIRRTFEISKPPPPVARDTTKRPPGAARDTTKPPKPPTTGRPPLRK